MVDSIEMARALRRAIDRAEISAWYQPQVDLRTQQIVGVEALCRWHHRDWGFVAPSDFIPVAEQDGAIVEIGQYMATEAVTVMAEWGIDVSVNVSPTQLDGSAFTTWLERFIQRVRRRDRRLTLEITEQRHLIDVSAVVTRLDRMRAVGFGIAIDDFGAGQASLTQLKRLHATELKIDRALVIDDSEAATSTMISAIEEAHLAGIRVVAEGIETEAQLEKVTALGCDRAQGYLLGRPMPRDEMTRRLAESRS